MGYVSDGKAGDSGSVGEGMMQRVADNQPRANRTIAPIMDDHGSLLPNAYLTLNGLMLFPESQISARQFVASINTEILLGLDLIDSENIEDAVDEDFPPPGPSVVVRTLIKETISRTHRAKIAGRVCLCLVQLDDHTASPSLRKAAYIVGHRSHRLKSQSAPKQLADIAKKHFEEFRGVVHFWAAWMTFKS